MAYFLQFVVSFMIIADINSTIVQRETQKIYNFYWFVDTATSKVVENIVNKITDSDCLQIMFCIRK